ncbi:MAG: hypothetical protein ABIY86_11790 [Rhodoferax sp.]
MGTGLATARGLEVTGFESDGVTFLAVDFALTFANGFAVFTGAALTAGLATGFATGLATSFGVTLDTALDGAAFAAVAGLATGFPLGLAATANALGLAAVALLTFPDLAFTSGLLAEISCASSVGPAAPALPLTGFFGWASPARECTGFPLAKPIRCKIETII